MIIGVPKEIKPQENRIGATPAMVHNLVLGGHKVLVQQGGGLGAGLSDEAYVEAGAEMIGAAADIFGQSDMIIKVKEPMPAEYDLIRPEQLLFTYFHFAANQQLTEAMVKSGAQCFAYETLQVGKTLPLLVPMSEVAGRMSIQAAAHSLEIHNGGRGLLMGGVPGTEPANVLVLGGGVVGTHAAKMAAGMGARVTIMDIDLERLRYLADVMPANCQVIHSSPFAIREKLPHADVVVGAILIEGARAPHLVRREDLKLMKDDGPVIVDVAVDQGGCVETCKPTTHAEPTFVIDGVVHYCVANMPGAVARTSTFALTNATAPWARKIADLGTVGSIKDNTIRTAANVIGGKVTHKAVADAFGMEYVDALKTI